MSKFDFICVGFGVASCTLLYFVLKLRVHVHINLSTSHEVGAVRKGRRSSTSVATSPQQFVPAASTKPERQSGPVACQSATRAARLSDIASGLVNLQINPGRRVPKEISQRAQAAAMKAVREHPDASFDIQFSVALQEVRRAA